MNMFTGWWLGHPSEKYESVSWDDKQPNIWENKKWQPNHQPATIVIISPRYDLAICPERCKCKMCGTNFFNVDQLLLAERNLAARKGPNHGGFPIHKSFTAAWNSWIRYSLDQLILPSIFYCILSPIHSISFLSCLLHSSSVSTIRLVAPCNHPAGRATNSRKRAKGCC